MCKVCTTQQRKFYIIKGWRMCDKFYREHGDNDPRAEKRLLGNKETVKSVGRIALWQNMYLKCQYSICKIHVVKLTFCCVISVSYNMLATLHKISVIMMTHVSRLIQTALHTKWWCHNKHWIWSCVSLLKSVITVVSMLYPHQIYLH